MSNAGGLGLLGAGSMHPETLVEHIHKMNAATDKPWGINVPLMYPEIDRLMDIIVDEGVKIVFTSAGSPKKFTQRLHEEGIKVAHVVSSSKFARKCEEAGVDAIVAAEALGAEGVQIGTLFALAKESSASEAFKTRCTQLEEGDTMLCLKKISPTRLVKNQLYQRLAEAEARGAEADELRQMLGKAASKRGIFEGDIEGGEIEIGQIASAIRSIDDVATIMARLKAEYEETKNRLAR